MIKYNQLSISKDGQHLAVDIAIESAQVSEGYYLSSVYLEYYENRQSNGQPSDKAVLLFDELLEVKKKTTFSGTFPTSILSGTGTTTYREGLFYLIVECCKTASVYKSQAMLVEDAYAPDYAGLTLAIKNKLEDKSVGLAVYPAEDTTYNTSNVDLYEHHAPIIADTVGGKSITINLPENVSLNSNKAAINYYDACIKNNEALKAIADITWPEEVGDGYDWYTERSFLAGENPLWDITVGISVTESAPVMDEEYLYEVGMGEVAEINECPRKDYGPFETFIVLWHALDLAYKAKDADQLDRIWGRLNVFSAHTIAPLNRR